MKGVMKTPVLTGLMNILATKPAQIGGRSAFSTPEVEVFAKLFEKLTQPAKPDANNVNVIKQLTDYKLDFNYTTTLKPGSIPKTSKIDFSLPERDRQARHKEPLLNISTEILNSVAPHFSQVVSTPDKSAKLPAWPKGIATPENLVKESKLARPSIPDLTPLPGKKAERLPTNPETITVAENPAAKKVLSGSPTQATPKSSYTADNSAVSSVKPEPTTTQVSGTSRIETGRSSLSIAEATRQSHATPHEAVPLTSSRIEPNKTLHSSPESSIKNYAPVARSEFPLSPQKTKESRTVSPADIQTNRVEEQPVKRSALPPRLVAQSQEVVTSAGRIEPTYTRPKPAAIVTSVETSTEAIRPDLPEVVIDSRIPMATPALKTQPILTSATIADPKSQVQTPQVAATLKPLVVFEPAKPKDAAANRAVATEGAVVIPARDVVKPGPVSLPSAGLKTVATFIPDAPGDPKQSAQTPQAATTTKLLAVEPAKLINEPVNPLVATERAFETPTQEVVVKSNSVTTTVPSPTTTVNLTYRPVVTTQRVEVVIDRQNFVKAESTTPVIDKSVGTLKNSPLPEPLTTSEQTLVQHPVHDIKRPEKVAKTVTEKPLFTNLRDETSALRNPLPAEHHVERFTAVEASRFVAQQHVPGMTSLIEPTAPSPTGIGGENKSVYPDFFNPSQAMSNFIESRVIQQLHVAVKPNKASVPAESKTKPEALFTIRTGIRSGLDIAKSESITRPLPTPEPQPERKNGSERPAPASGVSPFPVKQQAAESPKSEAAPTKPPQTASASISIDKHDPTSVASSIQPEARPAPIEAPPVKPFVPHPAPTTQPAIEMHELVSSIKNQTGANGSQKIELTLRPESLGKATALIEKVGEVLKLEFKVENAESQAAIEAESSHLRESLASAGFHNVSMEFSLTTSSRNEAEPQADPRQQHHRHQNDRQHEPADEGDSRRERAPLTYGYNSFELTA